MKKKIIGSVLVLGIVAAAAGLFVPNAVQKITKESVITSSQLEKAVDRAADLGKLVDTLGKIVKDEL